MKRLSKRSPSEEIKKYFVAVRKVAESNGPYPVRLDTVWPLAYPEKNQAVKRLKENFIENIDFIVVASARHYGKFPAADYRLALPCFEFLIARKVRPVFKIYRQVFPLAPERIKPINPLTLTKIRASLEWVKGVKDLLDLHDSAILAMIKQIGDPFGLPAPDYPPSEGSFESAD